MNIAIPWSQACVSVLNDSNVVPKPFRNLEQGYAGDCQNRGEAVAHGVSGHFRIAFLSLVTHRLHVGIEGFSEVVTVFPLTVFLGRHQGEVLRTFIGKISIKEGAEWSGEGDTALVAVFGGEGICLADMEALMVKPIDSSLNNLLFAQSCIEPAVQDKGHIVIWRAFDQEVLFLTTNKVAAATRYQSGQLDAFRGINDADALFCRPSEIGLQALHDTLRTGLSNITLKFLVVGFDVRFLDRSARPVFSPVSKLAKPSAVIIDRIGCVGVVCALIDEEAADLGCHGAGRSQDVFADDLQSLADSLFFVLSFEIHPGANPIFHAGKPITTIAEVDMFDRILGHVHKFMENRSQTSKSETAENSLLEGKNGGQCRDRTCDILGVNEGVYTVCSQSSVHKFSSGLLIYPTICGRSLVLIALVLSVWGGA